MRLVSGSIGTLGPAVFTAESRYLVLFELFGGDFSVDDVDEHGLADAVWCTETE